MAPVQRKTNAEPQLVQDANEDIERPKPTSSLRRACGAVFPAPVMVVIWLLVAGNYVAHVLLRQDMWNLPVFILGHCVLALQLVSFARAVHTHPGSAPADWQDASGNARVTDGVAVPPRAYYVRRMRTTVLGFDHYCWWLGCAVGWRNRKFFVLFVLWSALLSGFGCALSAMDMNEIVGFQQTSNRIFSQAGPHLRQVFPMAINPMPIMLVGLMFSDLDRGTMIHACLLFVLTMADLAATIMLGMFGSWHLYMILRNQTSLRPYGEEQYDVGMSANWRQVMGKTWWLWAMPTYARGDGPHGDGMTWPRRKSAPEC